MRSWECEFDENCTLASSIEPSIGTNVKLALDRELQPIRHPNAEGRYWDLARGDIWLIVPEYMSGSHLHPVARIHAFDGLHLGEIHEFEVRLASVLRGEGGEAKLDGYEWMTSI